ncbi:hypothetical protein IAR55_004750 [Kwoniella newhampshirensis]|uniref:Uncharacterized protein n=1 Tax=Kwoniella newhampshirensis TaxID=1651941 RepID=A0AAW0YZL4_9TREE
MINPAETDLSTLDRQLRERVDKLNKYVKYQKKGLDDYQKRNPKECSTSGSSQMPQDEQPEVTKEPSD